MEKYRNSASPGLLDAERRDGRQLFEVLYPLFYVRCLLLA